MSVDPYNLKIKDEQINVTKKISRNTCTCTSTTYYSCFDGDKEKELERKNQKITYLICDTM